MIDRIFIYYQFTYLLGHIFHIPLCDYYIYMVLNLLLSQMIIYLVQIKITFNVNGTYLTHILIDHKLHNSYLMDHKLYDTNKIKLRN